MAAHLASKLVKNPNFDDLRRTEPVILEKLDANHRELLASLERQGTRINGLETGLARVDERTRE